MTTKFGADLELPAEMRAIAEKNVTQARQAFETLFKNVRETVGNSEGTLDEVRSGVRDLRTKAVSLMQANVEASFDFLNKLAAAKSPQDMVTLQAQFLSDQMKVMAEQAQSLGGEAKALSEATARNFSDHAKVLADRVKDLSAAAAQGAQDAAQDLKAMGEAAGRDVKTGAEQASNIAGQATDPNRTF